MRQPLGYLLSIRQTSHWIQENKCKEDDYFPICLFFFKALIIHTDLTRITK